VLNGLRLLLHFLRASKRASFISRVWGSGIGFLRGLVVAGIAAALVLRFVSSDRPHWRKSDAYLVMPLSRVANAVYGLACQAVPRTRTVLNHMDQSIRMWTEGTPDQPVNPPS
jgi:uncharacterized membrane protein required for colicin V production